MEQAIEAYRRITATDEFREIERLRSRARHNEASALDYARREGEKRADEKWQGAVADKDVTITKKDTAITKKPHRLRNSERGSARAYPPALKARLPISARGHEKHSYRFAF